MNHDREPNLGRALVNIYLMVFSAPDISITGHAAKGWITNTKGTDEDIDCSTIARHHMLAALSGSLVVA